MGVEPSFIKSHVYTIKLLVPCHSPRSALIDLDHCCLCTLIQCKSIHCPRNSICLKHNDAKNERYLWCVFRWVSLFSLQGAYAEFLIMEIFKFRIYDRLKLVDFQWMAMVVRLAQNPVFFGVIAPLAFHLNVKNSNCWIDSANRNHTPLASSGIFRVTVCPKSRHR